MKRSEIKSVGDVLRQALEDNHLTGHLDELKAREMWPVVVGEHIASMALAPYVYNGIMTVRVPDAALRNELAMNRSLIIKEINRLVGKEVITSIRFKS